MSKLCLRLCLILCFAASQILCLAQTNGTGTDPTLVTAINTLLDDKALASGFQGVVIQSLKTGETVYELNADKTFLPASNNKLLTSAVALEKLGKDFVYKTRIYRTGKIDKKGVLHGDLILQGSGDPLLMPNDLKTLAQKVRSIPVRDITGVIGYETSLFDDQALGEGWSWDDEPFYYSAQVSALNVNENLIYVQALPGKKVGSGVEVTLGPDNNYVQANCTAYTSAAGTKKVLTITRKHLHSEISISGNLPIDIKPNNNLPQGVAIDDPPGFAVQLLTKYLKPTTVKIEPIEVYLPRVFDETAKLIAEHTSEPLSVYLKKLNKPSDNLVAECLLKTVGAKIKGKGTANADGTGATVALEWFKSIGLDTTRIRMADGSGLSRVNYVSPRNLVKLLAYMKTRPDFDVFYDSLPIAGVDGTMKNRLKGTAAANNCHAKTGTMMQVCSLSGYVTAKDGEDFAFSILMNNQLAPSSAARNIQDNIVLLLAEHTRSQP